MATEQYYPPEIWGYIRRTFAKKLKNASLAEASSVLNTYKPDGFGVLVVGQAELRKTRRDVALLGMKLRHGGKDFEVYLTLEEVRQFLAGSDMRAFVPATRPFMVVPKVGTGA